MSLDPIKTTKYITDKYTSYLANIFQLSDSDLQNQFVSKLQPQDFVKGPILETTPSFKKEDTLNVLVKKGILSDEFINLNSNSLPIDRPLYSHQQNAIQKIVKHQRNVVVATGTGSGKTETFTIPILNYLFEQKKHGTLNPGVRALLLYPMNALANDQLKRFRKLLANYPEITFGRYTGETEEKRKSAEELFQKMYKEKPLKNELISREEMKANPPHILLTNYAMLEYLLLRPQDNVFFDGEFSNNWKFIVVDEAHTYSGAKGIETAMLLRRLKERISTRANDLTCIATSATLGNENETPDDIAKFASGLFSEPFETEDIVKAIDEDRIVGKCWGVPNEKLYSEWQEILSNVSDNKLEQLANSAVMHKVPSQIIEKAKADSDGDYKKFLYFILKGDRNLISLQETIEEKNSEVLSKTAKQIFSKNSNSEETLVSLVDIANQARNNPNDQPLLPARYHLFIKSMEGAFVGFYPKKQLFLQRMECVTENEINYPVFEIGNCHNCGSVYIVGKKSNDDGKIVLKQPSKSYYENETSLEYYLLMNNEFELAPINEDEDEIQNKASDKYYLCPKCGAIDKINLVNSLCECNEADYIPLTKVVSRNGMVHKCPACSKTNTKSSVVTRFLQSRDAIASVLSTSLYQQIPDKESTVDFLEEDSQDDENEWMTIKDEPEKSIMEKDSRQLLIFSDNRQDAAFFAPFLNRTYSKILRRHLILQTIEENKQKIIDNQWQIEDIIIPLKKKIRELNLFPSISLQQLEDEAWKWLLYELMNVDGKNGLEHMGFLGFELVKPSQWCAPPTLKKDPWNLTEDEIWTLYQILLNDFRDYGAITFPDSIDPYDFFFEPKNQKRYFRHTGSSKDRNIKGWTPSGGLNSRLDFLQRLYYKINSTNCEENCTELLSNMWKKGLNKLIWDKHLIETALNSEGTGFQISHKLWQIKDGDQLQWYYCNKCKTLTHLNLKNICPNYRCNGMLEKCNPSEMYEDDHYKNLYSELKPLRMKAEEHTAQLSSETAADYQSRFINGDINVLSCSTTFELGVDVGDLESVFLLNVPPSASNYVQRAGRAGRRTDSTAFVLTFCRRRSHDMTYFADPIKMVSGMVSTPHFEIENEIIVQRHVYATALAKFWMMNSDMFKKTEDFFFNPNRNGPEKLREYLESEPKDLLESIKKIVPQNLHSKLNLDSWGWVSGLYDENNGVLLKAKEEVESDIGILSTSRSKRISEGKKSDYLLRMINTIKKRPLINYLSAHNVIPRYGFPIDVVELQLISHSDAGNKLELSRDLRMALSEYAPGSEIVAGGQLWQSRYLKKIPHREWPKYQYAICEKCHRYQRVLATSNDGLTVCDSCGYPLDTGIRGTFVVPEFGFISSRKPPKKPGNKKPKKTYTTRTYYSGEVNKEKELSVSLGHLNINAMVGNHGKLAIVNNAGGQGFKVCPLCGYTILGNDKAPTSHENTWGGECEGTLMRYHLGHEYKTDVLQLSFEDYDNWDMGFWYSVLYGLLEGASIYFDIERQDLDGCLYPYIGEPDSLALLIFDNVPGGAGHVKRIAKDQDSIINLFKTTYTKMRECTCGGKEGNSSCYGCLRNYGNQFCHEELNRGKVMEFLEKFWLKVEANKNATV
jgi:hypothetical protein